jgi:glycosyltransferase involved in cell wall biosynthesis
MRIALFCYRGNPYCGGQGIYVYHLSRELVQLGHHVTVFVGPPYPDPLPWAKVVLVPNHNFWGRKHAFIPRNDPASIFKPLHFLEFATSRLGYFPEPLAFSFRAYNAFRKRHVTMPFDVLHDVETLGYGTLLAKKLGVPTVCTVHHPLSRDLHAHLVKADSFMERYYNVAFFPLIMQGLVARRMDGVITSSRTGTEELKRAFRIKAERIYLVHTGVDSKVFSPDPSTVRTPSEVLFVGNAQDPRKGILYLLQALRDLSDAVHLTVVDQGEPQKYYAPALVRALRLEGRVVFTGKIPLETLVRLYRRASVLVMPSLFEGFGLPAVEAMASGTPVIATHAGSLPEVVGENQEGGILVPPQDSDALAKAIHLVTTQPLLREKLASGGRHRVECLFSWKSTAQKTTEVYRRVREGDKGRSGMILSSG